MNDLPTQLKELREWLNLSQLQMAVAMGATSAAYITWEEGTRTPRPKITDRLQASLTSWHATPKRKATKPQLPFTSDLIPECCGQSTKPAGKLYSRAKTRQMWMWRFICRKCGRTLLRDKEGAEISPLRSENSIELPFQRPECCQRKMKVKRKARELPSGEKVYFLHCVQPGCPGKGITRKFVNEKSEAREVTKELSNRGGAQRLNIKGERPKCSRCGRSHMVQGQRARNGEEQTRFGCYRHGGSRWYRPVNGSWELVRPYKHGPYGSRRSGPSALPEKLLWENRSKCKTFNCPRKGKQLLVHEFPPESKLYRYKLWCPECRRGARWLDASLKSLRPRGPGKPPGLQRVRIANRTRKKNFVIRDRNRLILKAKTQRIPTRKICALLDSKTFPILRKWRDLGCESWVQTYNKKPRLPIRLFSVIFSTLRKLPKRQLDYYFA
jgi:DNA-binding XRE family transcriptional regulator